MPNVIMAVDQILATLETDSEASAYYDYALSMVFANASARAASMSKPTSDRSAFLNSWTMQLGKLGWAIVEGGTSSMSSSGTSEKSTLSDLIVEQSGMASLNVLFRQTTSPQMQEGRGRELLSDWWESAVSSAGFLQMTVGQTSVRNDTPEFELVTVQLDLSDVKTRAAGLFHKAEDLDYSSVACLVEHIDPSSAQITLHNLKARLNMDAFAPLKADIIQKLGDKFSEHCATYPDVELG